MSPKTGPAGGDAVDAYVASTGGDAGLIEQLRREWGLDRSATARLAAYLWSLARLDLGWSVTFSRPTGTVIAERLPNTLLLMGSATAFSFGLGSALYMPGMDAAVVGDRARAFVEAWRALG